jgi:hypothetical protein
MLLGGHSFITAECAPHFAFCSHIQCHKRITGENPLCYHATQITWLLIGRNLSWILLRLAGDFTQISLVGEILLKTMS